MQTVELTGHRALRQYLHLSRRKLNLKGPIHMEAAATIGALATLTKALVEGVQSLKDLFGAADRRTREQSDRLLDAVETRFEAFQSRLLVLAEQLEKSEMLTKMIPAWQEFALRMPFGTDVSNLDSDGCNRLRRDLDNFLHQSIHDHFSTAFFQTQFASLPGVETQLIVFRSKLTDLERTVRSITPGNDAVFKGQWSTMSVQFNDAMNLAWQLNSLADDLHGRLILELKAAAAEATI